MHPIMLWSLLGVIFLSMGVFPAAAQEPGYKEAILSFVEEAYNQGNIAAVEDLLAEEFVRYPAMIGREEFSFSILALRAAMPDLEAEVDIILQQDDRVALRLRAGGTFQNDYITVLEQLVTANGQPVSFVMHSVFYFNEDGQVVEEWTGFDTLNLSLQMSQQPELANVSTEFTLYPDVVDVGMSEQNRTVVEGYFNALSQHDWGFIEDNLKSDFIGHNPFGKLDRGALLADLQGLYTALPDLSASLDFMITEGNWTAAVYRLNGTFSNDYTLPDGSAIPPTGGTVDLQLITFFRFEQAGLVAEYFELYDSLTFMVQLGLMAPVASGE